MIGSAPASARPAHAHAGSGRAARAPAAPAPLALPADARFGEPLLGRAGGENFPVAPRFLPRLLRRDLLAIYGFARLVDDLGDDARGDRLALLDALERDLDRAFAGEAQHPLLRRLAPVLRERALPRAPFARLIEANRRDQRERRIARWEDLLGSCADSANPVGRLVLHLLGAATPERIALADAVCSALQVLEHCQDAAEDYTQRDRIYLPATDLRSAGAAERDLAAVPSPPAVRRVVAQQVRRAEALLEASEPLVASLSGWGRVLVAGFAAGGRATADALARAGYDVGSATPRPRRRDVLRHALVILWRARRGGRP